MTLLIRLFLLKNLMVSELAPPSSFSTQRRILNLLRKNSIRKTSVPMVDMSNCMIRMTNSCRKSAIFTLPIQTTNDQIENSICVNNRKIMSFCGGLREHMIY